MAQIYGIEVPEIEDDLRVMSAIVILDMVDEDLNSQVRMITSPDLKNTQVLGLLRGITLIMEQTFLEGAIE